MLKAARAQVGSYQNDYHEFKRNYSGVAANSGMRYEKVVPDLTDMAAQPADAGGGDAIAQAKAAIAAGANPAAVKARLQQNGIDPSGL